MVGAAEATLATLLDNSRKRALTPPPPSSSPRRAEPRGPPRRYRLENYTTLKSRKQRRDYTRDQQRSTPDLMPKHSILLVAARGQSAAAHHKLYCC
jgi:hypothetical protein